LATSAELAFGVEIMMENGKCSRATNVVGAITGVKRSYSVAQVYVGVILYIRL
jgi:hypothetical protein